MFDYGEAFSRNLGWVTETEQQILRGKRIAIAGMGGVGGSHLLTLTRLGIGGFHLADFDRFEIQNFNRQAGAAVSTLDRPKVEVMADMASDINPELELRTFADGISSGNLDDFLRDVDLYVDSLDFFALDMRNRIFSACRQKGIPAVTAAPLGMGAALLVFMPAGMSYEQYFRMRGQSEDEQALRFMLGLAPARLQMSYLADPTRVDFNARRGPSTPMACDLCAGFAGTYALKILLNRGPLVVAPRGVHFDAYRNRLRTTWRPGGNNHPLQRVGLAVARRIVMGKKATEGGGQESIRVERQRPIERILDLGRWAPSGDNEQPWRFEIIDDHRAVVHAHDTRDWCVYDLDGSSSQLAVGALLETIAIAASGEGLIAQFSRRPRESESALSIDVQLQAAESVGPSPLIPFLPLRTTQRCRLSTRPLSAAQKRALEEAAGEGFRVIWLEGASTRWRVARLLFRSAHIRLTTPEAFEVHRRNIEWGARYSEDRLPEHALGVDLLTRRIMRWALQRWSRVQVLNRFFAGTWLPRLQMDLATGLSCGAHFVIVSDRPLEGADDYIEGGRAMQRFWLEATRRNLQFQPEMTPLIFSRYVAEVRDFTVVPSERRRAERVSRDLAGLLDGSESITNGVFMGRLGFGPAPQSRSTRLPLEKLVVAKE